MKGRAIVACFVSGLLGSLLLFQVSRLAGEEAMRTAVQSGMVVAALASAFLWKLIGEIEKMETMGSTDLERLKLIRHRCARRKRATWTKFSIYFLSSALVLLFGGLIKIPEVYLLASGFFCGLAFWCGGSMVRDYFVAEGHAKVVAERERKKKLADEFLPTVAGH